MHTVAILTKNMIFVTGVLPQISKWILYLATTKVIEVKSTDHVKSEHLKGLKAFAEEYVVEKKIVVSNDPLPRLMGNILVLPWQVFLEKLWANELFNTNKNL